MRRHPGPGRVGAAYPRVRVWWNGKFWMVARVRPDLRLSNEPFCFDTFQEALDEALRRRRAMLGEVRSNAIREKAR